MLFYKSSVSSLSEEKRINQIQIRNTELLEVVFRNKITKTDLLSILNLKIDRSEYFDKPQDNGVGLGTMFLRFDKKGHLIGIDAHSFEGP